jgi:hypothetical protein
MDQRLPPRTIIAVLDHVPLEMYEAPMKQFLQVDWIQSDNGPGVSGARNAGFTRAIEAGVEMVIPCDEDDWLDSAYAKRVNRARELDPTVQIWYPDFIRVGEGFNYVRTPDYTPEELFKRPFIISTAAINVGAWEAVRHANGTGYDERLNELGLRWEDYLFYLECACLGIRIGRIGLALVKVWEGGTGSVIANRTIPQWRVYIRQKLTSLYRLEFED